MQYLATTYKTITGTKELIELPKKKNTQWIVYQDDTPAYFVDFYDLEKESNGIMNVLVLCSKRSIQDVLRSISEKNNVNLSVPRASRLGLKMKLKSELRELDLQPLPEEWLSYSL